MRLHVHRRPIRRRSGALLINATTRVVALSFLLALAGLIYAGIGCPDPLSAAYQRGGCLSGSNRLYTSCTDDTFVHDGGCDTNSRHSAKSYEEANTTMTLYTRSLSSWDAGAYPSGYIHCDRTPYDYPAHIGTSTPPCNYCTGQ